MRTTATDTATAGPRTCVIIGAGAFGISTAIALRQRYLRLRSENPTAAHVYERIIVLEQGDIANPLAASVDVSRIVRADYGSDELYTMMGMQAIDLWHKWNTYWNEEVYQQTGVVLMTENSLMNADYERLSYGFMTKLIPNVERLNDPQVFKCRFPFWSRAFRDGYYNPHGGWVDNGRATYLFTQYAEQLGIEVRTHQRVQRILQEPISIPNSSANPQQYKCKGVCVNDVIIPAEFVISCCGTWTPKLFPELSPILRISSQPVMYFKLPSDQIHIPVSSSSSSSFPTAHNSANSTISIRSSSTFPVFAADLSSQGFYGFPLSNRPVRSLRTGEIAHVIKIAHHGESLEWTNPDGDRRLPSTHFHPFLKFVREKATFLKDAEIFDARICYYSDSIDGDFLAANHPNVDGLFVCAGDSGHAFKFMPLLGSIVTNIMCNEHDDLSKIALERFRWRVPSSTESIKVTLDSCRSRVSFNAHLQAKL